MNNWYVAMSRGEDAPVLDVTVKPINGAARSQHSAHSNQSSTEAGASLLHAPNNGGRIDVASIALPDSAAAPPIEPAAQKTPDWANVVLIDEYPLLYKLLMEHRGGCRCFVSAPCGACCNPVTQKEANMLNEWHSESLEVAQ